MRNVARAICHRGKEDVFLFCNTEDDAANLRKALLMEEKEDKIDQKEADRITMRDRLKYGFRNAFRYKVKEYIKADQD